MPKIIEDPTAYSRFKGPRPRVRMDIARARQKPLSPRKWRP